MIAAPTALLMLKAPIEGEVKTRLGREIGAAAATAAYRSLVEHQLRQIPTAWAVQICHAPASAQAVMRAWLGPRQRYSPQAEGDLGMRLARATAAHFQTDAAPLLILGGDCPYLETATLHAAATALAETNVVLAPAVDGGYCLLGLRKAEPHLFHDIPWSTEKVVEKTRERLRERRLAWVELATLEDVDDAGSWARAQRVYPGLGVSRDA